MSAEGARKLFVGGLADAVEETDLRSVFQQAGFEVSHLALPRDRDTGRLRGFAFVTLATEADAARARQQLQGVDCCGRPLSIREFSQDGPKRAPTQGQGAPFERAPRQELPTVFLGKLPFEATSADLQKLFIDEGVGQIVRLTLPMGPDGRPRGFGFATLESEEQVQQAVSRLNGASLMGRQIVVSPAQAKGAPGSSGGSSGGGGPRSHDGPPRRPAAGARYSDRPGASEPRSFDPFFDVPSEPPIFPPGEARGGARRRDGKKEKKEKKRGGAAGAAEGAIRAPKSRRGGGANWHRWEDEDD